MAEGEGNSWAESWYQDERSWNSAGEPWSEEQWGETMLLLVSLSCRFRLPANVVILWIILTTDYWLLTIGYWLCLLVLTTGYWLLAVCHWILTTGYSPIILRYMVCAHQKYLVLSPKLSNPDYLALLYDSLARKLSTLICMLCYLFFIRFR